MKIFNFSKVSWVLILLSGCGQQFLDVKPTQRQRVPATVADCQAMLDHKNIMNRFSSHLLGVIGGDEIHVADDLWGLFPVSVAYHNFQRNAYFWSPVVYEGGELNTDWSYAYQRILIANVVLDALDKLESKGVRDDELVHVRSQALFHRAWRYYQLAQLYCKPYNGLAATDDLGLPLRLEADPNLNPKRSSVSETYRLVTDDLRASLAGLPQVPINVFRPSKPAANALLARIGLQIGDYSMAAQHADAALEARSELMDFNALAPVGQYASFNDYGEGNPEVIYVDMLAGTELLSVYNRFMDMDPSLLASYGEGDLRTGIYFVQEADGRTLFRGSYGGGQSSFLFSGFAVDELYLIRAESLARQGLVALALETLNAFMEKRYDSSRFVPLDISDPDQVLDTVIAERRKELVLRGTRWEDLRRLSKEERYASKLERNSSFDYSPLLPGDKRWVWPLPREAVEIGQYVQNDR